MNDQASINNGKWEAVIGMEVHVETNAKTKMFCACSANYSGTEPNTHTCPVCLGLPGALPYTNQEAIEKCIKVGLALGCSIAEESLFERKNYFYPDLPKGYQISQYRWPLCVGGEVKVEGKNGKKTIRINRAHQEEDTGKLSHRANETFIDFNRSGVALVEIVTEPDFSDSSEVRDYGKKLQQIIRAIGVSAADMEKGEMRLEANISVRPKGQKELASYRVELKNVNSFKYIADAIDIEIARQIEILEVGGKITQHTRGYNENKRETFLQREKEEANDYRYFPEPDLPALAIDRSLVKKLQEEVEAAHPFKKSADLATKYGLSDKIIAILMSQGMVEYFESAILLAGESEAQILANYITNRKIDPSKQSPQQLVDEIKNRSNANIDGVELESIVVNVISENAKMVEDYKSGKTNAIQGLIGQVMKKTQGKADANTVRELLEKQLDKKTHS